MSSPENMTPESPNAPASQNAAPAKNSSPLPNAGPPPPSWGREGERGSKFWTNFAATIRHHIDAWRNAWHDEQRKQHARKPESAGLEFLPAVLEIQESPPSPAGRAIVWIVVSLFTLALLWATFGHIDIIAIAQGKIVPNDRSKLIQPLETGIVRAIHVRDGSRVKQGQLLIELDTTAGADRERFVNEHLSALTEVARLRALLAKRDNFQAPKGADPAFVDAQRARLRDQLAELRALESQAEAYKNLLAQQYVSQMQYLEVERQRVDKAQQHAAALSEAETRAHSLSKELNKAETRAAQQRLTAPIDGTVQQLAVYTVGGVVTPAQQLMVVAPEEGHIEIEAWVENKDIGFVNDNQEAEIKVDAFPFTRYGTIEGKVLSLSRDAVPIEKVGLVYAARVSMARSAVQVENGKQVTLSPGMSVTVEIKTGSRRLIEYFLSPLLRGVKEAARER